MWFKSKNRERSGTAAGGIDEPRGSGDVVFFVLAGCAVTREGLVLAH